MSERFGVLWKEKCQQKSYPIPPAQGPPINPPSRLSGGVQRAREGEQIVRERSVLEQRDSTLTEIDRSKWAQILHQMANTYQALKAGIDARQADD